MTSSAGGQDDGEGAGDGALITAGGVGDSYDSPPDPYACNFSYYNVPFINTCRYDDELYSLLPFVNDGDRGITFATSNPSGDDNLLFAALDVRGAAAIIGRGILVSPASVTIPVGQQHTLTATVQDSFGNPSPNVTVHFQVTSGPNAGAGGDAVTNASGTAQYSYTSSAAGTDRIVASFNSLVGKIVSNEATGTWVSSSASLAADVASVEVDEGSEASNTGTWSAPDDHPVELSALPGTLVQNANGTWSWTFAAKDGPSESQAVTVTAADANGGTDSCSFGLTVNNVAPSCGPITLATPVELGDSALLEASFTDPGVRDTHSATWDWGDGSALTAGSITEVGGNGAVTDSHSYAEAGDYTVNLTVTNKDGGSSTSSVTLTVEDTTPPALRAAVLDHGGGHEWIRRDRGLHGHRLGRRRRGRAGRLHAGIRLGLPAGHDESQLHNLRFGRQQLQWQLRRDRRGHDRAHHPEPRESSPLRPSALSGAVVTWDDIHATDLVDSSVAVTCSPASGSTFELGTTTVTMSAVDAAGNHNRRQDLHRDGAGHDRAESSPTTRTSPPRPPAPAARSWSGMTSLPPTWLTAAAAGTCVPGLRLTFAPGPTTVTMSAVDAAGNSAHGSFTVTVVYSWTGFFSPVDNLPTLNVAKAGSAITVKFSLAGDKGLADLRFGLPEVRLNPQHRNRSTGPDRGDRHRRRKQSALRRLGRPVHLRLEDRQSLGGARAALWR